jgi:hypothetical protein
MAQLLLIASYVILARFSVDVVAGGFHDQVALRGLKQSLGA